MATVTLSKTAKSPNGGPPTCFDKTTVRAVQKQMLADADVASLEEMFETLSDPTRIRILFALWKGGTLCVGDLAHLLGMTVSAVSHQLRKLRDRRMVKCHSNGTMVFYNLGDDPCIPKLLEFALCLARETAAAKSASPTRGKRQ